MKPNFQLLEKNRRRRKRGDVLGWLLIDNLWLFGRIVVTDAMGGPFKSGWPNTIVIYVFKYRSMEPTPPTRLLVTDLLLPPLLVWQEMWTLGYIRTIINRPFEDGEELEQHCFVTVPWGTYFDYYANPLPRRYEPCGDYGVTTLRGVDELVSEALGLPKPNYDD